MYFYFVMIFLNFTISINFANLSVRWIFEWAVELIINNPEFKRSMSFELVPCQRLSHNYVGLLEEKFQKPKSLLGNHNRSSCNLSWRSPIYLLAISRGYKYYLTITQFESGRGTTFTDSICKSLNMYSISHVYAN